MEDLLEILRIKFKYNNQIVRMYSVIDNSLFFFLADNTEAYKNCYAALADQLEILLLGFSTICHGINQTESYKHLSSQLHSIRYETMCSNLKISKTGNLSPHMHRHIQ